MEVTVLVVCVRLWCQQCRSEWEGDLHSSPVFPGIAQKRKDDLLAETLTVEVCVAVEGLAVIVAVVEAVTVFVVFVTTSTRTPQVTEVG